jgi:hypothetical protein
MKKLELIDKFMIIALIFFSMMFCSSLNAQEKRVGFDSDNENIYGEWISMDGDHRLFLNYTDDGDTFYRESPQGVITGDFKVSDKYLMVTKQTEEVIDGYVYVKEESYKLMFFLKGVRLIVYKPESETSEGQAWLFQKLSMKQTEY